MKLLVDQGNSRTKLAIVENDQIIVFLTADNFQESDFMQFISNKQIDRTLYASVAKMAAFLEEYCINCAINIKSLVTKTAENQNKLNNVYGFYDTLGADLLATAVYAHHLGEDEPTLTISMGSCITSIVVNSNGEFMGNSISPGLTMRAQALHQFTNALPLIDINKEMQNHSFSSRQFAKDTPTVILKGIISGIEGELLKNISDFKSIYPTGKVFITGGDAFYFSKILGLKVVDNMVLLGLNLV